MWAWVTAEMVNGGEVPWSGEGRVSFCMPKTSESVLPYQLSLEVRVVPTLLLKCPVKGRVSLPRASKGQNLPTMAL